MPAQLPPDPHVKAALKSSKSTYSTSSSSCSSRQRLLLFQIRRSTYCLLGFQKLTLLSTVLNVTARTFILANEQNVCKKRPVKPLNKYGSLAVTNCLTYEVSCCASGVTLPSRIGEEGVARSGENPPRFLIWETVPSDRRHHQRRNSVPRS